MIALASKPPITNRREQRGFEIIYVNQIVIYDLLISGLLFME